MAISMLITDRNFSTSFYDAAGGFILVLPPNIIHDPLPAYGTWKTPLNLTSTMDGGEFLG